MKVGENEPGKSSLLPGEDKPKCHPERVSGNSIPTRGNTSGEMPGKSASRCRGTSTKNGEKNSGRLDTPSEGAGRGALNSEKSGVERRQSFSLFLKIFIFSFSF